MEAPVSVIIPCYCCDTTIERAVRSVVLQTMVPREIILVEDCSNDGGKTITAMNNVMEKYRNDIGSFTVYRLKKNQGPSAARNAGWNMACQPYIAFLDADDAWHPKKIEIQYTWMATHTEVTLSCHRSAHLGSDQTPPELFSVKNWTPVNRKVLLVSNRIATRSVMIKRDIPYRFEVKKKYGEDYYLWLQIILNNYPAWYLDMPLCYSYESNTRNNNLSADLWKMEKGELDVYRRIFRDRLISPLSYLALSLISLAKFVRRVIMKSVFQKVRMVQSAPFHRIVK